MRIRFTWRPQEWREAYLLVSATPARRRVPALSMSYLVLAIMAVGGGADLLHTLYLRRTSGLHAALFPAVSLMVLVVGLLGLCLLRKRRRLRGLPAMPVGVQELVLQENGWNVEAESKGTEPMHAWEEICGYRSGHVVLAMLTVTGDVVGVPLRALNAEQTGSLHRMLSRKLAPFAR